MTPDPPGVTFPITAAVARLGIQAHRDLVEDGRTALQHWWAARCVLPGAAPCECKRNTWRLHARTCPTRGGSTQ